MSARVLEVLERFVPASSARAVYQRALLDLARAGTGTVHMSFKDRLLEASAELVKASEREALQHDLGQVLSPDRTSNGVVHRFDIRDEDDARRARMATRQLCVEAGVETLQALRLATDVGKLSTALVDKDGEGSVELVIDGGTPQRAHVRLR